MDFQDRLRAAAQDEQASLSAEEQRREKYLADRAEVARLWRQLALEALPSLQGVRQEKHETVVYTQPLSLDLLNQSVSSRVGAKVSKGKKLPLWQVSCPPHGSFWLAADGEHWAYVLLHGKQPPTLLRLGDPAQTYVVRQVNRPYDYRVFLADGAPFRARAEGGKLLVDYATRDSTQTHELAGIVAAGVHRLLNG